MSENLRKFAPIILLGLLIVVVVAIAAIYVANEHNFYFWDFATYQRMTIGQVETSFGSRLRPVRIAISTLSEDYNMLFTLPLIPWMRLLGAYHSRSTYIVSLSLVYLIPYFLIIGFIANNILPKRRFNAFWIMIAVAILTPAAWAPTWRGYPDTGGACFIGLAVWAYLSDLDLKKWWQYPVIGLSLAAAPLFRRHFAYGVTAFFGAVIISMAVFSLNDLWHKRAGVFHRFLLHSIRIGLVAAVSLAVLLTFGLPFVKHIQAQNYQAFSSWQVTPLKVFQALRQYYGWIGLSLACIGFIAGIIVCSNKRRKIAFIALFGMVSAVQWIFLVRQPNPHYTLHFTAAILISLGILGWVLWDKLRGAWRVLSLALLGIYIATNAVFGVAPQLFPYRSALNPLFAGSASPLQRSDYYEIVSLINGLHTRITHQEPIVVLASSGVLSYDLLIAADQALYPSQPLNLLFTPELDNRDNYAIETLLKAEYIIVGEPLQIHLALSEHEVLNTAYEALTENWEIAQDFTRLPETFPLMGGVQARLYQRIEETNLDVAIRTFANIQAGITQRPPNQPDWIQLTNFRAASILGGLGNYQLRTNIAIPTETATIFLYLGNMPSDGKISGMGIVNSTACGDIQLELSAAYHDGTYIPLGATTIASDTPGQFSIDFHSQGAAYLLLLVSSNEILDNSCEVILDSVEVSSAD